MGVGPLWAQGREGIAGGLGEGGQKTLGIIIDTGKTSSPPELVGPKTPNPPNWRLNVGSKVPILVEVIPETCLRVGDLARRLSGEVRMIHVTINTVQATMVKEQETNIAGVVVVHMKATLR